MLLDDIAAYLQTQGIGTIGVDIFAGLLPEQPDNCMALFEYAGSPPDYNANIERPGLQVRVRNVSYPAGRQKIEDVKTLLNRVYKQTINNTLYIRVFANQSPQSLGRDENGRAEFVINFSVTKERMI